MTDPSSAALYAASPQNAARPLAVIFPPNQPNYLSSPLLSTFSFVITSQFNAVCRRRSAVILPTPIP